MTSQKFALFAALLIFSASLIFYAAPMGMRPFFTRGEGREALVVSAMQVQHNLILPLRNGTDIPSKPPLFHWLGYLSSKITGEINEFAVRFPSALAAALSLMVFFVFLASRFGLSLAGTAAAVLAGTFEWNRSAGHARVDMCFSVWLTLLLLSLFWLHQNQTADKRLLFFSWLAAVITGALAVLAKGPTAMIIAVLIFGFYLLLSYWRSLHQLIRSFPYGRIISALFLAAALAGVWYLLAYQQAGMEFLNVQLLRENLARVVEIEGEEVGHEQPFYFSLVHLLLGFLPWSLLFPLSIGVLCKNRAKLWEEAFARYAVSWLAVFVIVVALAVSKRTVYLLPAYPAAALLVALSLSFYQIEKVSPLYVKLTLWLFSAVTAVLAIVCFVSTAVLFSPAAINLTASLLRPKEAADVLGIYQRIESAHALALVLFLAGVLFSASVVCLAKCSLQRMVFVFTTATLTLTAAVNFWFFPAYAELQSPKQFMAQASKAVPTDAALSQYKHDFYSAVFYSGRNIPVVDRLPQRSGRMFALVQESEIEELKTAQPTAIVMMQSITKAANGKERLLLVSY